MLPLMNPVQVEWPPSAVLEGIMNLLAKWKEAVLQISIYKSSFVIISELSSMKCRDW